MTTHLTHPVAETALYRLLLSSIPAISEDLRGIDEDSCAFKIAAFFAAYTKKQINAKNYSEAKTCFYIADKIVRLGSTESRQAIENVYLFALQRQLNADKVAMSLLPLRLKRLYRRLAGTVAV